MKDKYILNLDSQVKNKNDYFGFKIIKGHDLSRKVENFNINLKDFLYYFRDNKLEGVNIKFNYNAIKFYFKEIAKEFENVEMVTRRMSGMPVIKESRIPVTLIISCLMDNMSIKEISEEYRVNSECVTDAINYAIEIIDRPFYEGDGN